MPKPTQQDDQAGRPEKRRDEAAPETQADAAEALNDARALQQMIEGTPDSSDEFKRIEQKR